MKNLWLFRGYLGLFWKRLGVLACLILLGAFSEGVGIGLFFPLIEYIEKGESALSGGKFRVVFDTMVRVGIEPTVINFLVMIFLVILCSFGIAYLVKVASAWSYNPLMKQIRDDGFEKVIYSPLRYYHTISSGKMVSTFVREVEDVGQSLNFLINIVVKTNTLFVYAIILVLISWQLTIVVGVIALMRYVVIGAFIKRSRRIGDEYTRIMVSVNSYLVGIYQGIDVIKTCATEEKELKRFKNMTDKFMVNVTRAVVNMAQSSLIENALGTGLICIVIYLSIAKFSLPSASVLVFLFIVTRLIPLVAGINDARIRIAEYSSRIIFLKTIFAYNFHNALLTEKWGTTEKKDFINEIKVQGVNFSYLDNEPFFLKDINLTINRNETLAIVGESGAGKTTFVKLLLRLYEPGSGTITIDGVRISDISRESWRSLVSVVSQDTFVFDDTLENNIKYGAEKCNVDEFWSGVRRASADKFIDALPKKEKTKLGERGVKLSGGQRQRVAIARAILRNTPILILDEATSELDSVTEESIYHAVTELTKNRTVIVIAHRLSTIRNADRIVVFDKGKISEVGTHKELLENGYLYRKYHDIQIF